MNYRIQKASPERFEITDGEGEPVFSGPLSACESWLDQQEGGEQRALKTVVMDFLRRMAGRASVAAKSDLTAAAPGNHHSAPQG